MPSTQTALKRKAQQDTQMRLFRGPLACLRIDNGLCPTCGEEFIPNPSEIEPRSELIQQKIRNCAIHTQVKRGLAELLQTVSGFVHQRVRAVAREQGLTIEADYDDLFAEGQLGILRAAKHFDLARKVKFTTYASWWIDHLARRWCQDHQRTIRLPVRVLEMGGTYARAVREAGEDQVELKKIQRDFHIDPSTYKGANLITRFQEKHVMSLDAPAYDDNHSVLSDFVADDHNSPEDNLLAQATATILQEALDELTPRERSIIEKRLAGETLQEIGEVLAGGRSRERVRQIEVVALQKIRRYLQREEIYGLEIG